MDFVSLIGKNFNDVNLPAEAYSLEFENDEWILEEGLEPWWTVHSTDRIFQMRLTQGKIIETIWLHPVAGKFLLNNYTIHTSRESIRAERGPVESSRDNLKIFTDSEPVSWDRFKHQNHYVHFEYSVNAKTLRLITIMAIKVLPD